MRVLGKVKVTVVSLHQTHHSRHYSKLFHKIMYYRKCKLYLVYFHVRFAASSFSWKKQSNLFYQENHEINKICIVSWHFKQFFVILFLLIFLQIVPFFSFGWPRKSFSLGQKVAVSRWGSLILWRGGIKCNDGNVQTHQSHFSRPPCRQPATPYMIRIWKYEFLKLKLQFSSPVLSPAYICQSR